jgi:hypothetical protein
MENHTDSYTTALNCFRESIKSLGPEATAIHNNPTLYYLAFGLARLAEGLLAESQKTDSRLADIARRLPPV